MASEAPENQTQKIVNALSAANGALLAAIARMNEVNANMAITVAEGMPAGSNLSSATLQTNLVNATTDMKNNQTYISNQASAILFTLPHSPNSPWYVSSLGGQIVPPPSAPATAGKASKTVRGVTFTAVTAGINGNNISLVFDGVKTVATVCGAWNTANSTNQVSYSGSGTVILTATTVSLEGGWDKLLAPAAWAAPAIVA